jgi:hypothetical protein
MTKLFKTNFSNKNPEGERFFQKIMDVSVEAQNFCVTKRSDFFVKKSRPSIF